MASLELQKAISNWENKQKEYGFVVDENYIDTYCLIANTALSVERDAETGLRVSAKVKKTIEKFCIDTFGKTIWELERQKQYNGWDSIGIIDRYYEVLKAESYYLFESFIFYMEKNRAYEKRFYQPRRKTLKLVVNDLQELDEGKFKFYGLSMPSRVGKAIAYNTPVLTQNGWKKHGELTLYDRVIGLDGEFKRITAIHNPCQMEYKVTFSDGEEIICHGNHEWRLHDRNHGEKIRDVETKEIFLNYKNKDGRNRFILPNRECVSGSHSAVWVDPYTLGAWLGDGRNRNPDICGDEKDFAIVQKILDAGYKLSWETKHKTTGVKYYGFKGLREQLQKYGMCHSRKTTFKRIPSEYLVADEEQRLELLAGLLDTDGYLNQKEHRYQFTTNEEFLKNDFVSLVSTFGWRVSVTKRNKSVSSSGICANKPYWVISFNPTRYIPCQLERKKLKEYSQKKRLTIEKVEKIDNYIIGNCITVEDEIYCVGRTLKPTHNSTVCIFFLAWIALKRPNSHSAMGGHSGILAKGFYKELLNLITTPEYTFKELYDYFHPEYENKPFPTDKSSDEFTITLGSPDRFATITCRGIDGTWTGAVDVSKDGYLYVDDLVRDREHSLSPQRMENTFQEYLNKMVDRKNDGARELMVGTLWNVLDPLNRIRETYESNPDYRFRKIPALDENDESNFDYEINGFSTEYYREMREKLDNAEWMAKFQQQPFVREGLLFPEDEMQYLTREIMDGANTVMAVCDPAFGGADHTSMPVCMTEEATGKRIIIDWVYKKGTQSVTVPKVVDKIEKHYITELHIEQNAGGKLYTDSVKAEMKQRGINYCRIIPYYAPTKIPKEERIKANSDWVKSNLVFLPNNKYAESDATYKRSDEYQNAMTEVHMHTAEGKNKNDDAADSITKFGDIIENKRKPTRIMHGFL